MHTRRPLFNARTSLLLALALTLSACGDGVLSVDNAGILEQGDSAEFVHPEGEVFYLKDAAAITAGTSAGYAEFVAKSPFYRAIVMLTAPSGQGVEGQIQRPDGTWGEWTPLNVTMDEGLFHSFQIELPNGAKVLRVRGLTDAQFLRAELFPVLPPESHDHFNDDAQFAESHDAATLTEQETTVLALAHAGRWQVSGAVASAANSTYVPYSSAPPYNGGRNCSGSFTAGARELGNYLVANFVGASYFQGYNCREVRGSTSMSMHGTGRAIDVFVPQDRGQADNDLGDPVAAYLIQNAREIGIQLIIWDRSIWSPGRSSGKFRAYSGVHPHHDHLHIELTPEGAARRTSWFGNMGSTPINDPPPGGGSSGGQTCWSSVRNKSFSAGECVQMNYNSCGGTCQWAMCEGGQWTCADTSKCTTKDEHASCNGGGSSAASCNSSTLGRSVLDGEVVQMPYNSCGGTCKWAECNDGRWVCSTKASGTKAYEHASCTTTTPPTDPKACDSTTLGRSVPNGESVQMSYNACGGTCKWATCNNGDWQCQSSEPKDGVKHEHQSCGGNTPAPTGPPCSSQTLGRNVPAGEYVQMAYEACGGTCEWAVCRGGQWICEEPGANSVSYAHRLCGN